MHILCYCLDAIQSSPKTDRSRLMVVICGGEGPGDDDDVDVDGDGDDDDDVDDDVDVVR